MNTFKNLSGSSKLDNISAMKRQQQDGYVDTWLIMFIVVSILFLGAISFAVWTFSSRQDYKNNSDQKSAAAVAVAKQQEDDVKNKQFAEQEKSPYNIYQGPEALGSLSITYPKTWSAYVDSTGQGSQPLDGYFNKATVPSIQDQNSSFSLRVQVATGGYTDTLANLAGQQEAGQITIKPYNFPKLPKIVGVRVDGQVEPQKTGSMIVMPLRDKTLKLWTTDPHYISDFNNIILPNFTFSP